MNNSVELPPNTFLFSNAYQRGSKCLSEEIRFFKSMTPNEIALMEPEIALLELELSAEDPKQQIISEAIAFLRTMDHQNVVAYSIKQKSYWFSHPLFLIAIAAALAGTLAICLVLALLSVRLSSRLKDSGL